ncbi:MAG: hypothetical protein GF347_01270 [Candidatus Moranbacteria bacterium]|nr:hypothetical protein [Candidatus Moranbacteria bacterium]
MNKLDVVTIGLGNPLPKHSLTRHNVGFLALDTILSNYNLGQLAGNQKFRIQVLNSFFENRAVLFIKPCNFMNNSGKVLNSFFNYQGIDLTQTRNIIFHDDSDILEGKLKLTKNGSAGGHKGLNDIFKYYNQKLFYRVKIGVRPLNNKEKSSNFILSKLSSNNQVFDALRQMPEIFNCLIEKRFEECQNLYN